MQIRHTTGSALDASRLPPSQRRNLTVRSDGDPIELHLLELLRVSHLERRFGLAPHLAEVVSSLAWGGAR